MILRLEENFIWVCTPSHHLKYNVFSNVSIAGNIGSTFEYYVLCLEQKYCIIVVQSFREYVDTKFKQP